MQPEPNQVLPAAAPSDCSRPESAPELAKGPAEWSRCSAGLFFCKPFLQVFDAVILAALRLRVASLKKRATVILIETSHNNITAMKAEIEQRDDTWLKQRAMEQFESLTNQQAVN